MDRAILWKKARMTKDMKIDDELAAINDKIVSIYVINYFIYSVLKKHTATYIALLSIFL